MSLNLLLNSENLTQVLLFCIFQTSHKKTTHPALQPVSKKLFKHVLLGHIFLTWNGETFFPPTTRAAVCPSNSSLDRYFIT